MKTSSTLVATALTAAIILTLASRSGAGQTNDLGSPSPPDAVSGYFSDWFDRVGRTQAEQPHWMTAVVTITPRLEQEYRYDQYWETLAHGRALNSFGTGKGLELIPSDRVEMILGVPAYLERTGKHPESGWADWPLMLTKYRLLSADEEQGNYVLSLFLAASVPTGSKAFSAGHYLFTPYVAGGKGWGDFDVQSTLSDAFPSGESSRLGMPLSSNTAFQYHCFEVLWPEVEVNYTWWPNGELTGKNQVFLTPGLILGRIPVWERIKFVVGLGYQVAVTHHPAYNHNWILTVRTPF
jgi:hypothetical protein